MKYGLLALSFSMAVHAGAATCPSAPPRSAISTEYTSPGCYFRDCAIGQAMSFSLKPIPSFSPQGVYDPGYSIQPCDTVTWDFGDGTPEVTTQGPGGVQHTFLSAGRFSVTATIENALGSATVGQQVSMDDEIRIVLGSVEVQEDRAVALLPVRRIGGLTRTGSVLLRAGNDSESAYLAPFSQRISFGPGVTEQTVEIPIINDSMYRGFRTEFVFPSEPVGAIAMNNGLLRIREDEPVPELSIDDVEVQEGNAGPVTVVLTARLSVPIGERYVMWVIIDHPGILIRNPPDWPAQTATRYEDFEPGAALLNFERGQLSATMTVTLQGDTKPEEDERIVLALSNGNPWPNFQRPYTTVTILNDDGPTVPPVIADVQPASGIPGTAVDIHGTDLSDHCIVLFGTKEAAVRSFAPNRLSVVAPQASGTVNVMVTCPAGTALQPKAFTYLAKRRATGS